MKKNLPAVAKAIADLAADAESEFAARKRVAAWKHPTIDALNLSEALAPLGIPVDTPQMPADVKERIAQACIGVTAVDYCVADSATLVLKTRPDQSRCVSLLPTIHVAVVQLDQILADLNELYLKLEQDLQQGQGLTNCLTLITGPSKTADIEATLVHGVHGPKKLHILIVTG